MHASAGCRSPLNVEAGSAGPAQAAGDSGFAAAVGQKAFARAVADQAAVDWGSAVVAGRAVADWVAETWRELLQVKRQVGVSCLAVSMERRVQPICSQSLTMRFNDVSECSRFVL